MLKLEKMEQPYTVEKINTSHYMVIIQFWVDHVFSTPVSMTLVEAVTNFQRQQVTPEVELLVVSLELVCHEATSV